MALHHRRATIRKAVLLGETARMARAAVVVFLAPAVFAIGADDLVFAGRAGALALLAAAIAWWQSRSKQTAAEPEERAAAAALAMVLFGIASAWPMSAHARITGLDALFESVSALTTTGLSVLDTTGAPPSILFFRAVLEWTGGLWFLHLAIAVLEPVIEAARPRDGDAPALPGRLGPRLLKVWLLVTVVAGIALMVSGLPMLRAILHAMSAVAASGMSPDPEGSRALTTGTQITLAAIGLFAATGSMAAWAGVAHPSLRLRRREVGLFAFCVISVAAAIAISTQRLDGHLDGNRWLQSFLLAMQAQSSGGFEFSPVRALDQGSKLALCAAMAIGGCTLSVAGGIRAMRFLILLGALRRWFSRSGEATAAQTGLRVGHVALAPGVVRRAMLTMLCFAFAIAGSWLMFVIYGLEPLDSLVDVVAACTNAGLSAGVTSAELDPRLQGVLIVDMLLGRLEFLPFLLLVVPMRHARAVSPKP